MGPRPTLRPRLHSPPPTPSRSVFARGLATPSMHRRSFLRLAASTATAAFTSRPLHAAASAPKLKIGLDNFAVRAMQWKAPALIDYAASLKCDTLFISDLNAFESLEDAALRAVRSKAEAAGLQLYLGTWSICPTAKVFKKDWGTA